MYVKLANSISENVILLLNCMLTWQTVYQTMCFIAKMYVSLAISISEDVFVLLHSMLT